MRPAYPTIGPVTPEVTTPLRAEDRATARAQALALLADPRLTGMTSPELDRLTTALAPAQAAQASQRKYEQRGGPRRRAPGAGSTGLLSDADRVLVTSVYQRQTCSQNVLSDLLGINPNTIGQVIAEIRQLLTDHGHAIAPSTLRLAPASPAPAAGGSTLFRPVTPCWLHHRCPRHRVATVQGVRELLRAADPHHP
jgi:hypothetical protein